MMIKTKKKKKREKKKEEEEKKEQKQNEDIMENVAIDIKVHLILSDSRQRCPLVETKCQLFNVTMNLYKCR